VSFICPSYDVGNGPPEYAPTESLHRLAAWLVALMALMVDRTIAFGSVLRHRTPGYSSQACLLWRPYVVRVR
jgi:hypothetical protein